MENKQNLVSFWGTVRAPFLSSNVGLFNVKFCVGYPVGIKALIVNQISLTYHCPMIRHPHKKVSFWEGAIFAKNKSFWFKESNNSWFGISSHLSVLGHIDYQASWSHNMVIHFLKIIKFSFWGKCHWHKLKI